MIWECSDIPPNLVLAIINHESGGIIGRPSEEKNKAYEVLNDAGEMVTQSHAYGLMQCSPGLLRTYQDRGLSPKITLDDLKGKDDRAARTQIKLGCWYFAHQVRALHQYDPKIFSGQSPGTASDEQLKLALMSYAAGWGGKSEPGAKGLKPRLDELRHLGLPLTAASIGQQFPTWGQKKKGGWFIRPNHFAKTIFAAYRQVEGAQPQKPGESITTIASMQPMKPVDETKSKVSGMIGDYWPILLIAALYFLQRNGGVKGVLGNDEEERQEEGQAGEAGDDGGTLTDDEYRAIVG